MCQLQYVINHQLRIDGNCGRLSLYSIERGVLKNEIFQIRVRTFIIMPFLFNFFFGHFTTEISFVLFSSHPTLFLLTALIRASTFKNRNIWLAAETQTLCLIQISYRTSREDGSFTRMIDNMLSSMPLKIGAKILNFLKSTFKVIYSAGSRPWDKGWGWGGGGRLSRTLDKGRAVSKKCFLAFRVSVWSKNKGEAGPPDPFPGSATDLQYKQDAVKWKLHWNLL